MKNNIQITWWYRLLKVIWILTNIIIIILGIPVSIYLAPYGFVVVILFLFIAESLRRIFFYIITGKLNPEWLENSISMKLLNWIKRKWIVIFFVVLVIIALLAGFGYRYYYTYIEPDQKIASFWTFYNNLEANTSKTISDYEESKKILQDYANKNNIDKKTLEYAVSDLEHYIKSTDYNTVKDEKVILTESEKKILEENSKIGTENNKKNIDDVEKKQIIPAFINVNHNDTYPRLFDNSIRITGTTSSNCSSINVKAINSTGGISDSYTLESYKFGDTSFKYGVREDWNNLAVGVNSYTFIANCEGGQIVQDQLEMTITASPIKLNTIETFKPLPNYSVTNRLIPSYTNTSYYNNSNVIETQIDGDFNGWEGETIFKMMDGSIWQQSSYDYTYEYAYSPEVIIYMKNGSYYMKVEDVDDVIEVTRLR